MRVGVGLPGTIPGARPEVVLEWARRADSMPFAALSLLDRIVYDNFEPLACLAAAAAVTTRIELASTVVISPLRNAAVLAKQAATIQALSSGRLTLGVGLGAREDDYAISGTPMRDRGQRLTGQLAIMRDIWENNAVGPRGTERPRLLVGGAGGLAASRMSRYADGYVHGGGPPRAFARAAVEARAAWEDLGRPGRPDLWGMAYFQLDGPEGAGARYLKDYYAFTGAFAERIAAGLLSDRETLCELMSGYEEVGCDTLVLFPTVAKLDQLERLAEMIAGLRES